MTYLEQTPIWDRLRESLSAAQTPRRDSATLNAKLVNRARVFRSQTRQSAPLEIPLVFLAFHQVGQRYGIPIDDVLEVQTLEQFTPVPRAPACIPGVVHWRGSILAILDLGKLFGVVERGIADMHACVIVEAAHRRIALVAGEVEDILSVPRTEIKIPPALPGNIPAEWLLGVHDENRMILRMDLILQDGRLENWK